jgi:hypothetical protein
MNVFKFTTPTGQLVEVTGPAGSTYEQAQAIFNQQSTTGSLVGLKAGDVLNSLVQAKGGLSTAWAQLATSFSQNISLNANNTSIKIPNLPAQSPVNISTFVNTRVLASGTVGLLSTTQVQGLMASTAASVNQNPTDVTNEKGLGTYGLTPNQLQQAGLIKPGTADLINQDPANTVSILNSPTVWTGKGGATDLDAVLTNETLQASVQQGSMATSYDQLTQLGAVNETTIDTTLDPYAGLTAEQIQLLSGADPTDPIIRYRLGLPALTDPTSTIGPIVNNAANFGVGSTLDWLNNTVGGSDIGQLTTSAINSIFGQSFGAVNQTVSGGGNPLQTGIQSPKGYSNTVNRSVIDASFNSIIGNDKIPKTIFAQTTLGIDASTVRASATSTVTGTTSLLQKLASTPAGAAALTAAAGASAGAASLLSSIQSGVGLYKTAQSIGKQIESVKTLLASPEVTNLIKELPGGQTILDSFKDGTGGAFDEAGFEGLGADPVLAEANLEAVTSDLAGFGEGVVDGGAVFDSQAFAADYGSGDVASDLADFFG